MLAKFTSKVLLCLKGINFATAGGNTRREWGNIQQTTNRIFMLLPMSKLDGVRSEMERLAAKYTEMIESYKVAICIKEQRRSVKEEEARSRDMARRRADMDQLGRAEAERSKAERRSKSEEAARMES